MVFSSDSCEVTLGSPGVAWCLGDGLTLSSTSAPMTIRNVFVGPQRITFDLLRSAGAPPSVTLGLAIEIPPGTTEFRVASAGGVSATIAVGHVKAVQISPQGTVVTTGWGGIEPGSGPEAPPADGESNA